VKGEETRFNIVGEILTMHGVFREGRETNSEWKKLNERQWSIISNQVVERRRKFWEGKGTYREEGKSLAVSACVGGKEGGWKGGECPVRVKDGRTDPAAKATQD